MSEFEAAHDQRLGAAGEAAWFSRPSLHGSRDGWMAPRRSRGGPMPRGMRASTSTARRRVSQGPTTLRSRPPRHGRDPARHLL